MTRAMAITHLRLAGYHADRATFTRLYVENRVSLAAAKVAYREGEQMRERGVRCSCLACQHRVNAPPGCTCARDGERAGQGYYCRCPA